MKKLIHHIRPLAALFLFLLILTAGAHTAHLLFSDCDHSIALHSEEHDEDNVTISHLDTVECDFCKFTPPTPTLEPILTLDSSPIIGFAIYNGGENTQILSHHFDATITLRGPPSLS